jgi:hypothetical protein
MCVDVMNMNMNGFTNRSDNEAFLMLQSNLIHSFLFIHESGRTEYKYGKSIRLWISCWLLEVASIIYEKEDAMYCVCSWYGTSGDNFSS